MKKWLLLFEVEGLPSPVTGSKSGAAVLLGNLEYAHETLFNVPLSCKPKGIGNDVSPILIFLIL